MSLRLRLSVILTSVLLATVVVAMTYLTWSVRRSISDESNSSIELSSGLLALVVRYGTPDKLATMIEQLGAELARFGDTGHLRIGITTDSGAHVKFPVPEDVPQWFVQLVYPELLQLVRVVRIGDGHERIVLRTVITERIARVSIDRRRERRIARGRT